MLHELIPKGETALIARGEKELSSLKLNSGSLSYPLQLLSIILQIGSLVIVSTFSFWSQLYIYRTWLLGAYL